MCNEQEAAAEAEAEAARAEAEAARAGTSQDDIGDDFPYVPDDIATPSTSTNRTTKSKV